MDEISKKNIQDRIDFYTKKIKTAKDAGEKYLEENELKKWQGKLQNYFQNGRIKALSAITNKAMAVGVKLINTDPKLIEQAKSLGAAAFARGEQASTPNREYIKLAGQNSKDSEFLLRAYQQGYNEAKTAKK